jgi:PKD repeat protein
VIWSLGGICQSLLANPTSTADADVQRRARVAQRNVDFNQVLHEVCAATANCLWDGWAAYDTPFTAGDVSGDYFHPSVQGQAKLAQVSWLAGYWAGGAPPPPNQAPTASFAFSCSELACSFDAQASTDGDGIIVAYEWAFGTDGVGSGVTAAHTFGGPGTHDVTLTVTDDDGDASSSTQQVSVTAPPPPPAGTVSIGELVGASSTRRGGWTAQVTVTAVGAVGDPVAGATVDGTWTTGGSGGCTTGAAGSCTFSMNVNKKTASVSWTVTIITHATLTYEPAGNASDEVAIARP